MASKNKKDHKYTDEEKQFLVNNIDRYSYKKLTEQFNKQFKTDLTQYSISDMCLKRMKIHRNYKERYKKGAKTFNSKPIGTETMSMGHVWVKIGNQHIPDSERCGIGNNPNWKKKSILTWETYHGTVEPGNVIVFLDKNKMNCDIENLYCVSRKINFMMAKNGWYTTSKEHTLTGIKWCELFYSLN